MTNTENTKGGATIGEYTDRRLNIVDGILFRELTAAEREEVRGFIRAGLMFRVCGRVHRSSAAKESR